MASLLLALDQGTTNTKALLVDREGQVVFRASEPLTLSQPQPGWAEQDPLALWHSAHIVMERCAKEAHARGATVAGIAVTNQRETALAWHRGTHQPLAPAVSWQCRRPAGICEALRDNADSIRRCTGLPLDPVLSATKWGWMQAHVPAVQAATQSNELCFGTVDSWILFKLTAGAQHATDLTNASRTGLLDLGTATWSREMVALFGLPASALPTLRDSCGELGICTAISGLEGIPIIAALGDSHAALAGHGAFTPGTVKATYGTGSSLMTLTAELREDLPQLARTIAWSIAGRVQYALEGNLFMAGSAVQWVGEFLGLLDPTSSAVALAATVPDAQGAYFVPAMVGLGTPHWRSEARGLLCGLERSHTAAHLARAAVDAIVYQVADVFFAMREHAGLDLPVLRADGGATRNRSLMQFQADILGVPVLRSQDEELSALGAAFLGGLAIGFWPSLEAIAALPRPVERIEPVLSAKERAHLYKGWQAAVERTTLHSLEGR